ncbi:MAG: pyridoxamine 5'-phosphate oxidase [Pseudomonadota bacterium]
MTKSPIPPSPTADEYDAIDRDGGEIPNAADPFDLFKAWLAEAGKSEPNDPNAMSVATVSDSGQPNVRILLLKDVDARGFTFFSNAESAKGGELAARPRAALGFHWKTLKRQVRVRGPVEPVSEAEIDAYFATRARQSRIGAWASDQSRPLASRKALKARMAEVDARYEGEDVPRPPHWTGYRLKPLEIEFWADRPYRLHDRLLFSRAALDADWATQRLYP